MKMHQRSFFLRHGTDDHSRELLNINDYAQPFIREALARKRDLPPDVFKSLLRGSDNLTREALLGVEYARKKPLSDREVDDVIEDGNHLGLLSYNKHLTKDQINRVLMHHPDQASRFVDHPNFDANLWGNKE